ncbi:hypothetical protein Gpo141_00006621, partial [Globisporangium polare]
RKTTERGAKLCKLNDSCLVFTVNLLAVMTLFAVALYFVASLAKLLLIALEKKEIGMHVVGSVLSSLRVKKTSESYKEPRKASVFAASGPDRRKSSVKLTTFEKSCVGGSVLALMIDCEAFCYTVRDEKRYITVEGVLLAGFVYDGGFLYRSDDALLLFLTGVIPLFLTRTFNIVIPRWEIRADDSSVAEATMTLWCDIKRRKVEPVALV